MARALFRTGDEKRHSKIEREFRTLSMLLVCPRCSGSLPPDARACPRCGLVLPTVSAATPPEESLEARPLNGHDPGMSVEDAAVQSGHTTPAAYVEPQEPADSGTAPYSPPQQPSFQLPVRPRTGQAAVPQQAVRDTRTNNAALLVPRGAVEMLANESVVFQLGALYLTNKRVILLAPTVLRTAFLRDVDAVGTLTERASGWTIFFGLLLLAIAGGAVYFSLDRQQYDTLLEPLRAIDPRIIAVLAGLLAIYLFVNYFFWIKRTLFLSVGGRPLITVSITDWNARKLEGMDQFINAFAQVKDAVGSSEPSNWAAP
jgi:hypothetical protein